MHKINGFTTEDTRKIKGWAIILMFIHHCFLDPERYEGQTVIFDPFSEALVNKAALSMKICVALFVFISAYGITVSYKRKSDGLKAMTPDIIRRSLYRRSVKLWMNYAFIFVLVQLWSLIVVKDGRYALIYGGGAKGCLYFAIDMLGLAELFGTPTFLATFWYISLAWIIIFIIPLLLIIYKKTGSAALIAMCILISALFPVTGDLTYAYFPRYIVVIGAGIIAADTDLFTILEKKRIVCKAVKFILYAIVFMALLYVRYLKISQAVTASADAAIAVVNCAMFCEFINRWPLIRNILAFIGKYATDMFLIHNFIRIVWYYDFTYSFKYWWLIVLVLLATSLGVSILIEAVKKLTGYEKLTERIAEGR